MILSDEIEGLFREQVVGVFAVLAAAIARQMDDLLVLPQVVGIIEMGLVLIEMPIEVIEALEIGDPPGTGIAQAPFAYGRRPVAGLLQVLGHGEVIGLEPDLVGKIVADSSVAVVEACHEAAPGGCADGRTRIALRESQTLGGHAIHMGRQNPLLAIAPHVGIAEVVGENDHDVRLGLNGVVRRRPQERRGRERQRPSAHPRKETSARHELPHGLACSWCFGVG